MDIIDILLARALTPQGQVSTYAAKANQAAANARAAVSDANAAVDQINSITEQTNINNENAAQAVQDVNEALKTLNETLQNLNLDVDIDAEIAKLAISTSSTSTTAGNVTNLVLTYPDGSTSTIPNLVKVYNEVGNYEDGTLSPKAVKEYVDSQISNIQNIINIITNINVGIENHGKIIVIDEEGNLIPSNILESDLVDLLLKSDSYTAISAVGLDMDYENKTFARLQEAIGKTQGQDFNSYSMYGGRMRCNVSDNGVINAFYGDENYTDDGSNGQVLVYQPKFYYQRIPIKTEQGVGGTIIRHERVFISDVPQVGFRIHPLFINDAGEEVDYVLTPAYEGSIDAGGLLCSIAGVQPANNITCVTGEAYAAARGTGWHMTTMQAESASQMLQMIEYGMMNGQIALEKGICDLPDVAKLNISCLTGSTASLGNTTGAAPFSVNVVNGKTNTYDTPGRRAISYRGMENPWGNIWHIIGNVIICGDGTARGGVPYVCTDFSYDTTLQPNYKSIGFNLVPTNGWISAMGKCTDEYNWIFMPIECSDNANSAAPVGDNIWVVTDLTDCRMSAMGGNWHWDESEGLFFYACDQLPNNESLRSFGASLMYLPVKNNIYKQNIAKWHEHFKG